MASNAVRLLEASSFSRGLRLDVDAFQLGEGESPDLLNVDLDPRGGVAQRRAVVPVNASAVPFTSPIHSLFDFAKTDGTEQILVGSGLYTYYGTGANFTSIGTTWTASSRQRAVAFRDALYIQNGTDAPRKWTGSVVSNLAQVFNDNLAAPDDGDMPIAKTITAWQGYVWIANTYEAATRYGSRVRFSHPNRAEDWETLAYIDIDVGRDGDEITALVPLADRLLVFKNHSVHMITGYDAATFAVTFVGDVGAPSQEAVAATEYGVYFFSWPNGLHFYNDRGIQYEFDALYPAIRDGDIPDAYHANATVGWLGRRVFVNVPWGSSTLNNRTFILTPGKGGGWTQYDLPLGPMLEWRRRASEALQLAATSGASDPIRVLRLDQSADTDIVYTNHLTLTGASGSYASAPDTAPLSIAGDLDIRVLVAANDYSPSGKTALASKTIDAAGTRGWGFAIDGGGPTGQLQFYWSADGTATTFKNSTVTLGSVGINDNARVWLRVTHDVDNGAAGNDVRFYYSYDGLTWTQLGATVTTAGVTSHFNNAATLRVGARDDAERLTGKFYYAELRNGIGGAVVAQPDFTALTSSVSSFSDGTNTWTINSPASLNIASANISSYYMTRWFDAGSPAVVKRWKRPDLVLDADYAAVLRVGVFRDYEPGVEQKWYYATIVGESAGMMWGSGTWGSSLWGAADTGAQAIDRGGILGRGRSVALKIAGPTPSKRWSVNSINFKYRPRRVR